MNTYCIIIPCYNEELRLPIAEYELFLKQDTNAIICFVNDGSTDKTESILKQLLEKYPEQAFLLSLDKNKGKAEAVRSGVFYSLKNFDFTHLAYIDADLSTSPEECIRVGNLVKGNIEFCFGSRILKIGSTIDRLASRHYPGRVIATFISLTLDLKVYDTQCGCKVFTKELAKELFFEPFISTWLFDVELFARMLNKYGKQEAIKKMLEVPLNKWLNKEGSKVSP
ncbi:MAG TPA: glycosyltransferase, partial [Bacteroidia bacterium]|nr:glycosyltransferase [Bacteroidia bacterium]